MFSHAIYAKKAYTQNPKRFTRHHTQKDLSEALFENFVMQHADGKQ